MRQQTPLKQGTSQLARSGFARRAPSEKAPVPEWRKVDQPRRAPDPRKSPKALKACKGKPCYLLMPDVVCSTDDTVVPAHENMNKGMGLKTPDVRTIPACFNCHFAYDQGNKHTREVKRASWLFGFDRWTADQAEAAK